MNNRAYALCASTSFSMRRGYRERIFLMFMRRLYRARTIFLVSRRSPASSRQR